MYNPMRRVGNQAYGEERERGEREERGIPWYWQRSKRFSRILRQVGSSSTASTRMPTGNWSLAPWPPLALACSFSSSTVISGGSGSANPTAGEAAEPRNQAPGSPKQGPSCTYAGSRQEGRLTRAVVWILEIQETAGKGGEVKAGEESESSTRRTQAERERWGWGRRVCVGYGEEPNNNRREVRERGEEEGEVNGRLDWRELMQCKDGNLFFGLLSFSFYYAFIFPAVYSGLYLYTPLLCCHASAIGGVGLGLGLGWGAVFFFLEWCITGV
jgi:hypothetical protein